MGHLNTRRAAAALLLLCIARGAAAQSEAAPNPLGDVENAVRGVFNFFGGLLDPKASEFKAHVDAGRMSEAAAFYIANEADLSASAGAKALLPKVVGALNASRAGDAQPAALRVAAIPAAIPAADWPRARLELDAARRLLVAYDAEPLLRRPEHRAPSIAMLEQALREAERRLDAAAEQAFGAYDHASPVLFFDAYPVPVDAARRQAIARGGAERWIASMASAGEPHARRLAAAYGAGLDAAQRERLSAAYVDVLARSLGIGKAPDAAGAMRLLRALRQAGMSAPRDAVNLRVLVLQGSGPGMVEWRARNLPVPVEEIHARDLPALVSDIAAARSAATYLLLDPHRAFAHNGTSAIASTQRKRLVGHRTEPNPDWEAARRELESATQDLAQVEQQNQQNQQQAQSLARQSGGSGIGMLGAIAGSSASTFAVASAQERVRKAQSTFQSTPQTRQVAQYQAYAAPVATVEAIRKHEVAVYVVEGATGRFTKRTFAETVRRAAQFQLGTDPADPDHASAQASNAAAKERLASFLKEAPPLQAETVWSKLEAESTLAGQEPIGQLLRAVQADQRAWQQAAADEAARLGAAQKAAESQLERR